jgi:hypothetical protein
MMVWIFVNSCVKHDSNPVIYNNAHKALILQADTMSRHVSVVMWEELFRRMEKERGRESKSSYVNHALQHYFRLIDEQKEG